jgi:Streptomyces sporulation and cell division protein, SsgA
VAAQGVTVDIDVDDPGPAGVPKARRAETHRRVRRTVLRLSWQRDDPLAVRLQLISTPDHPALPRGSWVVLRDFLRYGLEEATGDGEVRINPETPCSKGTPGVVAIRLARDGRPAWVQVPCASVREFLNQTEVITPSGEESSEEALDALIKALLKA